MKMVRIGAHEVGLVFRNGSLCRMVKNGVYWFWASDDVQVYKLSERFNPPCELNILLQNADLKEALHLIEVWDHEIVIVYENGLLKQVLTAGRYAYWRGLMQYSFIRADISKVDITEQISPYTLDHVLLAGYIRTSRVESYEKALLFIDGIYVRTLEPGVYTWWRNATTVHVGKVDTRTLQLEVNGQEILTRDKAALRVNAWAQYKVKDIEKALLGNKEYDKQLYVALQLALREYIGGMSFDELLEKKDLAIPYVLEKVAGAAAGLGVEVSSFGIRDIILPGEVREIMNQVLVAEKKAQANIIMRREETASTRSLLNTAKLMEDNPMLFKLKEMEYVEKIAEKISHISVNGDGMLIDQLRQIFAARK